MTNTLNNELYVVYMTNTDLLSLTNIFVEGGSSVGGIFCMMCTKMLIEKVTLTNCIGTYGAGKAINKFKFRIIF